MSKSVNFLSILIYFVILVNFQLVSTSKIADGRVKMQTNKSNKRTAVTTCTFGGVTLEDTLMSYTNTVEQRVYKVSPCSYQVACDGNSYMMTAISANDATNCQYLAQTDQPSNSQGIDVDTTKLTYYGDTSGCTRSQPRITYLYVTKSSDVSTQTFVSGSEISECVYSLTIKVPKTDTTTTTKAKTTTTKTTNGGHISNKQKIKNKFVYKYHNKVKNNVANVLKQNIQNKIKNKLDHVNIIYKNQQVAATSNNNNNPRKTNSNNLKAFQGGNNVTSNDYPYATIVILVIVVGIIEVIISLLLVVAIVYILRHNSATNRKLNLIMSKLHLQSEQEQKNKNYFEVTNSN